MSIQAEYIPFLISVSVFFSILLFVVGIYYYVRQRASSRATVEKIRGSGREAKPIEAAYPQGRLGKQVLDLFGSLGGRIVPRKSEDLRVTQLRFLQAGFRRKNAAAIFWGVKVFIMTLLPVSFLIARLVAVKLMSTNMTMTICILMALIGFYSPDVWIRVKIANRRDRIFRGLPDALDLLVVCVEAGLGLDGAISRVADEIGWSCRELSDELKLLNLELRAGKLRQEALRNLARRIDLEDMRNLATLLIQTDKFGTSVANALRVYSDSLRTKRYQRAEEVAVKLPTKLIFPLILFIFPALFVAILGPAAINFYRIFLSP